MSVHLPLPPRPCSVTTATARSAHSPDTTPCPGGAVRDPHLGGDA
jgi:hypothetical protein